MKDHLPPNPRTLGPGPWRWPSLHVPVRVWVWTAVTLVLAVVATLLWRNSDAAATTHTTAAPAGAPEGAPAGALSLRWSATGAPVPDSVVVGDRVILGSPHGMRAVDVVTGREAWRYERNNARLCGLTGTDGVVIAVFRQTDRCDEAVALTASTGVFAWTRNLWLRPDATLSSAPRIVLATSPTGLVTIDPTGDNIRWRYRPPQGCTLISARVGGTDVAVVLRCANAPAPQLRLLDGFGGQQRWTVDLPAGSDSSPRLINVDRVVGVQMGDTVQLRAATDGAEVGQLPLVAGGGPAQQLVIGGVALVAQGGTLTAVDAGNGAQLWQQPALGLPAPPSPATATEGGAIFVPEDGAFVQRDLRTGAEAGRSTASAIPAGGAATRVGPVMVYRVGDRVLGYR